ncbi:hypothetical protein M407DRAFT_243101 [Tulasnella calospora MUT 4182]|uniref:Uncharacterized protein n=1 Tax=Tulasnella calospora MUT 4182 TaxID=1051891 RepID=A0A0C3QMT1_9AGAM|nr:hypothetical protein M407DRAFT_243101 [Tulasnella calospora MUT 4182]
MNMKYCSVSLKQDVPCPEPQSGPVYFLNVPRSQPTSPVGTRVPAGSEGQLPSLKRSNILPLISLCAEKYWRTLRQQYLSLKHDQRLSLAWRPAPVTTTSAVPRIRPVPKWHAGTVAPVRNLSQCPLCACFNETLQYSYFFRLQTRLGASPRLPERQLVWDLDMCHSLGRSEFDASSR